MGEALEAFSRGALIRELCDDPAYGEEAYIEYGGERGNPLTLSPGAHEAIWEICK